ncbi:MAG: TonB C-terminal domain-containing protein [Opitutales bacterium]
MPVRTTPLPPSHIAPRDRGLKRSLIWAAVIHAVALLALILSAWLPSLSPPEPEPVVFELALDAPVAREIQTPAAPPSPPRPSIRAPEIPAPADIPLPPPPQPEPQPVEPPPIEPPPPEPASTPESVRKPEPKRVSYSDFIQSNPLPKPKPEPAAPAHRPRPQLDTSAARERLEALEGSAASAARASTNAEQAALSRYLDRLQARIEATWDKPPLAPGPSAEIALTVLPDGRIVQVRLLRKDAPEAFVDSVIAAARNVPPIGPTPTGQSVPARFTFRLR